MEFKRNNGKKEYYNKFVGKELDILVEECDNNVSIGHSSNYLMIRLNVKTRSRSNI